MSKENENKAKNPNRDDIGMVGNIAWETEILFPRISRDLGTNGYVKVNNPKFPIWIKVNANPP